MLFLFFSPIETDRQTDTNARTHTQRKRESRKNEMEERGGRQTDSEGGKGGERDR